MVYEDKIYSSDEMRTKEIYTDDYAFNYEEGTFKATLVLKARGRNNMLRLFFRFDDGRKIIAPVYWWHRYLGLADAAPGTYVALTYVKREKGVFLEAAEVLGLPEERADQ